MLAHHHPRWTHRSQRYPYDRTSALSSSLSHPTDPTRHAAPATLRPMQRPTPISAHAYGEDCARKWPTLNASPCPCGALYQLVYDLVDHAPVKRRKRATRVAMEVADMRRRGRNAMAGMCMCRVAQGGGELETSLCGHSSPALVASGVPPPPPTSVTSFISHLYPLLLHLSQPCSQTQAPQTSSTRPNRVRQWGHRTQACD